jgi:hypothetical protein
VAGAAVAGAAVAGAAVAGAAVAGAAVVGAVPQALRARLATTRITNKLDTNLDFIIFSSKLEYIGIWYTFGKIIYLNRSICSMKPPPLIRMD